MDCRDNTLTKISKTIAMVNEPMLLTIGNKGLYKRANKEIEAGLKLDVQVVEDALEVTLEDSTKCIIKENLKESTCSCPATSMCKHIIISLLYLKNNWQNLFDTSIEKKEINYDFLDEISLDFIKKNLTSKELKDILFRLDFGIEAKINKEDIMVISFEDLNYSVTIFDDKNIVCSKKCTEFCSHKSEALIHYQIQRGVLNRKELNILDKREIDLQSLYDIEEVLKSILNIGLYKLSDNVLEELQLKALLANRKDFIILEKLLESIRVEIKGYFNKDAKFSRAKLRYMLTKALLIITSLRENGDMELLGEKKSSFTLVKNMKIYALGLDAWSSKNTFVGITSYFYNKNLDKVFSYSNVRGNRLKEDVYNDVEISKSLYEERLSVSESINMKSLSKSIVYINRPLVNKNYRLSFSGECEVSIRESVSIEDFRESSIFYDDFSKLEALLDEVAYSLTNYENIINVVILEVDYIDLSFDDLTQKLKGIFMDKLGNDVNISIPFKAINNKLIKILEKSNKNKANFKYISGRVYKSEGQITFWPIAIFREDKELLNLMLDEVMLYEK